MEKIGPYAIGSEHWPGASRLIEETGELLQTLGKLIGNNGRRTHWDKSNLYERLEEELGDVLASMDFFLLANSDKIHQRCAVERAAIKINQYIEWHKDPTG